MTVCQLYSEKMEKDKDSEKAEKEPDEKDEEKEKKEEGMVTLVVTMEEELLRMIEASGCFGESQRETGEMLHTLNIHKS